MNAAARNRSARLTVFFLLTASLASVKVSALSSCDPFGNSVPAKGTALNNLYKRVVDDSSGTITALRCHVERQNYFQSLTCDTIRALDACVLNNLIPSIVPSDTSNAERITEVLNLTTTWETCLKTQSTQGQCAAPPASSGASAQGTSTQAPQAAVIHANAVAAGSNALPMNASDDPNFAVNKLWCDLYGVIPMPDPKYQTTPFQEVFAGCKNGNGPAGEANNFAEQIKNGTLTYNNLLKIELLSPRFKKKHPYANSKSFAKQLASVLLGYDKAQAKDLAKDWVQPLTADGHERNLDFPSIVDAFLASGAFRAGPVAINNTSLLSAQSLAALATDKPHPSVVVCLPSGSDKELQAALDTQDNVILCANAGFRIHNTVKFKRENQVLRTEGRPQGSGRARLTLWNPVDPKTTAVLEGMGHVNLELSYLIIDGNATALSGLAPEAADLPTPGATPLGRIPGEEMILLGNDADPAPHVAYVLAGNTRSGSSFKVRESWTPTKKCARALIEHNVFGPSGITGADGGNWADGVTFACTSSVIDQNLIYNPTDGGIVLFGNGVMGTHVTNNKIVMNNPGKILMGGINLVDYGSTGDFSGVEVLNNQIIASNGGHIALGIAMGPQAWCQPKGTVSGAKVSGNQASGDVGIAFANTNSSFSVFGNSQNGNPVPDNSHVPANPLSPNCEQVRRPRLS